MNFPKLYKCSYKSLSYEEPRRVMDTEMAMVMGMVKSLLNAQ